MRANVYIDGFNFYYCAVRNTKYKWLDFSKLVRRVFPKDELNRIRYFTARVSPPPNDPQKAHRQDTYLRALSTTPGLSIHEGNFLTHKVKMLQVNPPPSGPFMIEVWKTEEKGSDVNLASYLLLDGFRSEYELAIVITNDSDLVEPVRMVRHELGPQVAILNPQADNKKTSWSLVNTANYYRRVRPSALADSQFPDQLVDANGTITRPQTW